MDFDNICVLKCTEKHLLENIKLLCSNGVEYVQGFQNFFSRGKHFYFVIADRNTVENIGLKGRLL